MSRLAVVALLSLLVGCTPAPGTPASASDSGTNGLPSLVFNPWLIPASAANITGIWLVDKPGIWPPGTVPDCGIRQVVVFQQTGNTVTGYRSWFGPTPQIPPDGDSEIITGTQDYPTYHLVGQFAGRDGTTADLTWTFTFDSLDAHLTGTRGGAPMDAAQLMCATLGEPGWYPPVSP